MKPVGPKNNTSAPARELRKLTPKQLANLGRKQLIKWLNGQRQNPPHGFFRTLESNGRVSLVRYEGSMIFLTGGLPRGKKRPCWVTFEEKEGEKLVHVRLEETDKKPVNSFFLTNNGKVLIDPLPLKEANLKAARAQSKEISNWFIGNELDPPCSGYSFTSDDNKMIRIKAGPGKRKILSGRLKANHTYWLTLEARNEGAEKLVHLYEEDKKTLVRSFYLKKDGNLLKKAEPLNKTSHDLAVEKSQAIVKWWRSNGNIPESFEDIVSDRGIIYLTSFKGDNDKRSLPRYLRGGLDHLANQPCHVIFKEEGNSKIAHVFTADRKLPANSYYLVKNGTLLDTPEPIQKSHQELIRNWLANIGPIPPAFETTSSKGGRIHLFSIGSKARRLSGRGKRLASKHPYWIVFEEQGNNKIVHIYEADRETQANSYYLSKDGQVLEKPEPFEASPPLSPRERLRAAFGRGDYDSIAAEYFNELLGMAPYWVVVARNSLLLSLAQQEVIDPFKNELSLGAGPSTSYIAWNNLEQKDVKVTDYEQSQPMLEQGPNPSKIQGSMTDPLKVGSNSFDLVTIDSAFRYVPTKSRASLLLEINRTLRDNGILSITELGYSFGRKFVTDLERLGFRVLTPANFCMQLNHDFKEQLRRNFPPKVVQSIAKFLKICGTMLAVKEADISVAPAPLPNLELIRLSDISKGNGTRNIIPEDDFSLGNFHKLLRTILGVTITDLIIPTAAPTPTPTPAPPPSEKRKADPAESPARRRARERLEGQLRHRVNSGVDREEIISIVLDFSEDGSLIRIAKEPKKLKTFNRQISKLGYVLKITGRGKRRTATLTQIN